MLKYARSGYFIDSITKNATWTSVTRYGNSSESEEWTEPFCNMLEYIDQPDVNRNNDGCPPKSGWATIHMEGWVW